MEKPEFFMDITSRSTRDINFPSLNGGYFKIYHQNVRSLRRKTHELVTHLYPDLPHILCLTEHHLNTMELRYATLENYTIAGQFRRSHFEKGGVVMYIHNSLNSTNIDLSKYCKEKDMEICAVKLKINVTPVCVITVYRSPSGNFNHFLQSLDAVLQTLYTPAQSFIICGDININYLVVSEQRKQLDTLLFVYNLKSIVDFPTRHNCTSSSAVDNIFIDITCFNDYSLTPFYNDLSDHDAQILTIKTLCQLQQDTVKIVRKVDQHAISDFIYKLSQESLIILM